MVERTVRGTTSTDDTTVIDDYTLLTSTICKQTIKSIVNK